MKNLIIVLVFIFSIPASVSAQKQKNTAFEYGFEKISIDPVLQDDVSNQRKVVWFYTKVYRNPYLNESKRMNQEDFMLFLGQIYRSSHALFEKEKLARRINKQFSQFEPPETLRLILTKNLQVVMTNNRIW